MLKRRYKSLLAFVLITSVILSAAFIPNAFASDLDLTSYISMDMRDADIRDILSALAMNLGKNIIFTSEPKNVDFSIQDVSAKTAFEYLLKKAGFEYIESDGLLIVGSRDTLATDFMSNISLTKFNLNYIQSDVIASQIDALGIQVQKVILDTNKKAIWVQGLPRDLAKIGELINMLDRSENSGGMTYSSSLVLTPFAMNYITAEQMNDVLREMGIPGGMVLESNPMTLWIYGSNSEISEISKIKEQVDIPANAMSESLVLVAKKMKYLTVDEIIPILNQMQIGVNTVIFPRSYQTIWLNGDEESIKLASTIIDRFDIEQNANDKVFFVYKLTNISAKEAAERLKYLDIKGVQTYTFDFPQLTKSIMVFCPNDYNLYIMNHLSKLDVMTEKIKVPVDYSDVAGGSSKLKARRDLIVALSGIPASSFTISENVSRTSDPYYIMYLEETAENIQKVKDLIKFIDDPLLEGSN